MWGTRLGSALLVVVLVSLGIATAADACSCAPQPPAESLREADGAVVGRLVKVMPHGAFHAVYRYEVRHVYKGAGEIAAGKMLDVRSSRRAAACALPRRTGQVYGLFLARAHGHWFSGICGVVSADRMRAAAQKRPRVYRRSAGQATGACGAI